MTKIVHFEITADDVAGTAKFYSDVFGWPSNTVPEVPDYTMLDLGDGMGGAIMSRRYKQQPAIIWFQVGSIDETVDAITKAGGRKVDEKHLMPGVGYLIYVADPAGTIVGLLEAES